MARQRLRPDKIYSKDDLKAAQKVFREFCGDNSVMMEPFAAADLCAKIAVAIAQERERCAQIAESHTTNLDGDEAAFVYRTARKIAERIRPAVGTGKQP